MICGIYTLLGELKENVENVHQKMEMLIENNVRGWLPVKAGHCNHWEALSCNTANPLSKQRH